MAKKNFFCVEQTVHVRAQVGPADLALKVDESSGPVVFLPYSDQRIFVWSAKIFNHKKSCSPKLDSEQLRTLEKRRGEEQERRGGEGRRRGEERVQGGRGGKDIQAVLFCGFVIVLCS